MKLKVCIAFVAAVFVAVPLCAQELGDKIQKEFTVNGEKVTRMVEYTGFYEYNQEGKLIHEKHLGDFVFFDIWYEYDTRGNLIHEKNSDGYEFWAKYDSNDNLIYSDFDVHIELDSNSNVIWEQGVKTNNIWCEFTYWPNGKPKTMKEFSAVD